MTRGVKSYSGYRLLNHSSGTRMCEPTGSIAWETGPWKPASSENGVMKKMVVLIQSCFVAGTQGLGKLMSGRKDYRLEKNSGDVADG